MSKKKYLFGIFAIAATIAFQACGPKGDNNPTDPTNQGVHNFIPTKTQNWWIYRASDSSDFTRRYSGRDTVVDGFNYNLFNKVYGSGSEFEYYAKFEGKYYTLLKLDNSGTNLIKSIVLTGDPKVGDTWTNTGSINYGGINFPVKIDGEVISVTGQYQLSPTKTLDSVVEVKSTLYAKILPVAYTNCGTVTMKFRSGVGILFEDYNISISNFFSKQYSVKLKEYHVE